MRKIKSIVIVTGICILLWMSLVSVQASDSLSDGNYSVSFTILKANSSEPSMMNDYVTNEGTLTIENGKKYMTFTLTESAAITGFKVDQNGTLVDTKILNSNPAKNTREVQFEINNLAVPQKAWVSIYMNLPGFTYDSSYDIQIAYDVSSIMPLTEAKAEEEEKKASDVKKKQIVIYLNSKNAWTNGKATVLTEAPYTKDQRTLVPLRFISENLGAKVNWDSSTRTITVSLEGKTISLQEGSKQVTVNGVNHTIEAAPEIKNGATFVPLRFISEQLGVQVEWNATDRSITMTK
ncbi:stalk domain-containing protein [Caldalkalibacillus mannanilyticus]|uniref:stalk domain-containing protein n=1 Tax=Caldalkalibacillus mannanilyticus TaxID=1418 RepID=UPI000469E7CE|nr:stalk domain-containing protein [Caldalkalibacillus mannanilyticus]